MGDNVDAYFDATRQQPAAPLPPTPDDDREALIGALADVWTLVGDAYRAVGQVESLAERLSALVPEEAQRRRPPLHPDADTDDHPRLWRELRIGERPAEGDVELFDAHNVGRVFRPVLAKPEPLKAGDPGVRCRHVDEGFCNQHNLHCSAPKCFTKD